MQNTTNNTTKIKEKIPHGGLKIIAKMSGTTIYTVSRVVNGRSENQKVKKAITKYLNKLNKQHTEFNNAVNSIQ